MMVRSALILQDSVTLKLLYAIIPFNVAKIRPLFLLVEKLWFRPLPTQPTQEMNIHALSSIQTCNSNNQVASDLHLRLHSHWDRLTLATRNDVVYRKRRKN